MASAAIGAASNLLSTSASQGASGHHHRHGRPLSVSDLDGQSSSVAQQSGSSNSTKPGSRIDIKV
jgi:hypothetical protein